MIKRAVLFDLDNTLYEYDPPHKKALFAVYKELKNKIKLSRKKFDFLFKISKQEIHRELSGTASAHNRILYFQRLIEKTHNTIGCRPILKVDTPTLSRMDIPCLAVLLHLEQYPAPKPVCRTVRATDTTSF